MAFAMDVLRMALTRNRVFDLTAAISGVLLLMVFLVLMDQRVRSHVTGAGTDLASVGADVNYFAATMTFLGVQIARGELASNLHVVVFSATAIVLVVLLIRL